MVCGDNRGDIDDDDDMTVQDYWQPDGDVAAPRHIDDSEALLGRVLAGNVAARLL